MSYTVTIRGVGTLVFEEKNKDEVISLLMSQWHASTGTGLRVEWPDGSYIELEEFE